MLLTKHENETFLNQTVYTSGQAFVRCNFIACIVIIGVVVRWFVDPLAGPLHRVIVGLDQRQGHRILACGLAESIPRGQKCYRCRSDQHNPADVMGLSGGANFASGTE